MNYYHDMWPHQTHILEPLTTLMGKTAFQWGTQQAVAFQEIKAVVTADTLLNFITPTKPLDEETNASDYQLGAIIKQDGVPIAFYLKNLNSAQHIYTLLRRKFSPLWRLSKIFGPFILG